MWPPPYIANFFHIEHATWGLRFAGSVVLIQSFYNIGQTLFFRDLNLKGIFLRDMVSAVTYSAAVIALALLWHSFWAPFFAAIIAAVCTGAATYALHPYRPRLDFRFSLLEELRVFTQWLFGQEIVNQSALTIQNSLIGHFTSPASLGLFTKAQALADGPTASLVSAINKVTFTSYVRVKESLPHVGEGLVKTLDILAFLAFPYLTLLLLTGTRIVHILLGDAWLGMTPFLQILAIESIIGSLAVGIVSPVFNALAGRRCNSSTTVCKQASPSWRWRLWYQLGGVLGAAYALLLSSGISAVIVFYQLVVYVRINVRHILLSMGIIAFASAVPVPLANFFFSLPAFNTTLGYLCALAVCAAAYFLVIILVGRLLGKGPYKNLELVMRSLLRSGGITRLDFLFLYGPQEPETADITARARDSQE